MLPDILVQVWWFLHNYCSYLYYYYSVLNNIVFNKINLGLKLLDV